MHAISLFLASAGIYETVYFTYFLSVMLYGIIFWGNSTNSKKAPFLQKEIIRNTSSAHGSVMYGFIYDILHTNAASEYTVELGYNVIRGT
jgi:hypothetical protein